MLNNFSLTADEVDLLQEIYDIISFQSIERGNAYFKKGNILTIRKHENILQAEIKGNYLYHTRIDLDEGYYQCTCPADPPCKHLATLIIASLYSKRINDSTQSLFGEEAIKALNPAKTGDSELVLVIDDGRAHCFAKKKDNTPVRMRSLHDLAYFKDEWQKVILALMSQDKNQKLYHTHEKAISVPIRSIIDKLQPNEYPIFYKSNDFSQPIEFGGFIEYRALFVDCALVLNENPIRDIQELIFYFSDPFQNRYFYLTDSYLFNENRALFLNDRHVVARVEGELNDFLKEEHKDEPSKPVKNMLNKNLDSVRFFYFLTLAEEQKKVIDQTLYYNYFTIEKLYRYRNMLSVLLSKKIKNLFDEAWQKGPALAISLYLDENEEKKKIKGSVEFVYAQKLKSLKPTLRSDKPKTDFSDALLGFPANSAKKSSSKLFDLTHPDVLVIRSSRKEAKLLEKADIPFSYKKKTGEFAFTTRFLKKFALEYLPIFKEKKILLKFDESLLLAVSNLYRATFNIEGSSKTDWFQGKIEIKGLASKDTKLILSAYRKKEELVKLSNGQWFIVDQLNIDNIYKTLENIGIRLNKDGASSDFNRGQLIGLEPNDELEIRAEKKIENLKKTFKQRLNMKDPIPLELSPSLDQKLRSYQKEGVSFFLRLFNLKIGGILADDMGLGKTIQTIAFIESIVRSTHKKPLFLVICPMAGLSVWELESQKFAPELNIQIWHGLQRKSITLLKEGVVITTYMTLAQDVEILKEIKFTCIFIDEAQNIKNVTTKASKCVRKLQSDSFFCLTGTPVENYLSDLWSLLDICFSGLLGTKEAFKKAYGSGQNLNNQEELLKRISPFILRRKKEKVLHELPQKSEQSIYLPLHDSQMVIYEKTRREAVQVLKDAGTSYLIKMLPYLMRLRRICCHPDLKNEIGSTEILGSSKLDYIKSKIPEVKESSSGALIFSQFTDVLKKVAQLFDEENVKYFYLDGSITAKKRKESVERFQNGERTFFLISLKAGGTALTLHRADTVFHLDPWWNPASENQATDRVHRIGQRRNVFVYKLIAKDTIEEKVIGLQQKKQKLFDALFDDQKHSGQVITKDQLMDILK